MNRKFVIIIMTAVLFSLSSLPGNCQTTVSGYHVEEVWKRVK